LLWIARSCAVLLDAVLLDPLCHEQIAATVFFLSIHVFFLSIAIHVFFFIGDYVSVLLDHYYLYVLLLDPLGHEQIERILKRTLTKIPTELT
jgi:hypothetical protein